MKDKIYLNELYQEVPEAQKRYLGEKYFYDLNTIAESKMRDEMAGFIKYRASQVMPSTLYGERKYYKKLCLFIEKHAKHIKSFLDRKKEVWIKQFRGWMFEAGIPLTYDCKGIYGNVNAVQSKLISYFKWILEYTNQDDRNELEKDIWKFEKLDIQIRENPIKKFSSINYTRIYQTEIKQELKRAILLNLQHEAISCVQREMTAMRRLSKYLASNKKDVRSCRDINRSIIEDYLIYLKTEITTTKHFHSELTRLRYVLEIIGKIYEYKNLDMLFLNRDIPPTPRAEFKVYSDNELKRLNYHIVRLDEQIARAMVIHQMLGTRISDTLTLQTDCLETRNDDIIIKISQMKTKNYKKPISKELAYLIQKAIEYTQDRFGSTKYVFVNNKNPTKPLQYNELQRIVVTMIHKLNLLDDNGEVFGFGTHMYRHYYGVKLTEMHLDDYTIAKLLGHNNIINIKYYRKMSNQMLADETRKARQILSNIILQYLDGWEAEYEQIRQNARLEQKSKC